MRLRSIQARNIDDLIHVAVRHHVGDGAIAATEYTIYLFGQFLIVLHLDAQIAPQLLKRAGTVGGEIRQNTPAFFVPAQVLAQDMRKRVRLHLADFRHDHLLGIWSLRCTFDDVL